MMRKSMAVIVDSGSNMTSLRAQYEALLPKYGNLWRRMAPRQAETTREPLSLLSSIENGQSVSLRVPSKCNACPWDSSCQGCSEPILEIDEESSSDSSIDTAPVRFDLSHLRLDDEKSEESEEVTSPQATSAKLENQETFRDSTGNNDSSTTSPAGAMAKNDSNYESESSFSSSSSSGTVEAGWDLSFLRLKEDNEEAKDVESESNTIGSRDDKQASDDDLFAAEQKWMEARAKEQEASSQLIDLLDDSDSDNSGAVVAKKDPPIVNTRSKSHKIDRRPRIEFDSDDSSSEEEEWDDKIQSPIVQQEESAASQVINGSPTVIVLSDNEDNADDAWLDDEDQESANDTSQDGDSFDEATSRIPDMIVGTKDSARAVKGPSKACFRKNREQIADTAFAEFDRLAFNGALLNVELVWSNKLRTTAGLTRLKQRSGGGGPDKRIATIELSSKIIDEEHRLRSTLLHEMCHAAAWLVDGVSRPPHGACFKKWANIAMQKVQDVIVTTTHDYEISFKYAWACTAPKCAVVIKRHSRSVDVTRHCCGKCKSKLVEIEVPSEKGGNVQHTPRKKAPLSGYNLFVKEHSKSVRDRLTKERAVQGFIIKVSQPEVMKECARLWRERNAEGPTNI